MNNKQIADLVVEKIVELKVLSIPIVSNGIPHVRLDEVGNILRDYMNANVTPIYEKVEVELKKCNPQEDTH